MDSKKVSGFSGVGGRKDEEEEYRGLSGQ